MGNLPVPNVIGGLLESEDGKKAFRASIEKLIAKKLKECQTGNKDEVRDQIIKDVASMKTTADRMREKYPESAGVIDEARERLLKLIL